MEKRARRSVSVAIRQPDHPGDLLLVRRPSDDAELPDAWGLPAASLRAGEDWSDAAIRAGRDKLGVELDIGRELDRGSTERPDYVLEMRLYEATIARGTPAAPQAASDVTQYTAVRWGPPGDLAPAAERGSLCCRLFLRSMRR
jgi:8-oxo-dGTP diphosphatase